MLLHDHVQLVDWRITQDLFPVDLFHGFRRDTELLPGLGGEYVVAFY